MLLGYDLLYGRAVSDMKKGTINFNSEDFQLNVDEAGGKPLVAHATVCKRSVTPSNSVNQIKCQVIC